MYVAIHCSLKKGYGVMGLDVTTKLVRVHASVHRQAAMSWTEHDIVDYTHSE